MWFPQPAPGWSQPGPTVVGPARLSTAGSHWTSASPWPSSEMTFPRSSWRWSSRRRTDSGSGWVPGGWNGLTKATRAKEWADLPPARLALALRPQQAAVWSPTEDRWPRGYSWRSQLRGGVLGWFHTLHDQEEKHWHRAVSTTCDS